MSSQNNQRSADYRQGFKEGASAAIHKFVNDLWEELELNELFDLECPSGERPRVRKAMAIEELRVLLEQV